MVPRALPAALPGGGLRSIPSPHRLVRHLWGAYCYALATSPLATQSLTAGVGFASGDACAQLFSGDRAASRCRQRDGRLARTYRKVFRVPEEPDWQYDFGRTARLAAFGGMIAGPLGHVWFQALDRCILPKAPRSVPAITLKCVMDQAFMAPLGCALFYAFERCLAGKPETVASSLRTKFVPTLMASYRLWPAAHLVNFALVPSSYRVLYTNLVSVVWTFILSKTAADTPLVAAAGSEVVPLCEGAEWEQVPVENSPDVHLRPAFVS